MLHVSPAYLNECVKTTTGHSVSYWIQQQIILEAKRLLGYSDLSIKEIASGLGYDDYAYFTRLFTKAGGCTPARFRKKYRV
jgi:AraC family transcriptional activator of pobA